MENITSRKNQIITHFRNLGSDHAYRNEHCEYVCDGEKLLHEAVKWGADISCVLWACEPTLKLGADVRQFFVPRELLDYASPLKSGQDVLFSVGMKQWQTDKPERILVLETVQDPGNIGTVLRTANALNVDTVLLTGACADIYNPKTVRASMGAVFRQRSLSMELGEMKAFLDENGFRLYGAALSDVSTDIRDIDLKKTAVAIGSEGRGLSPQLLSICDGQLIIPMNGACESLNAAIAAAIVMWELTR